VEAACHLIDPDGRELASNLRVAVLRFYLETLLGRPDLNTSALQDLTLIEVIFFGRSLNMSHRHRRFPWVFKWLTDLWRLT